MPSVYQALLKLAYINPQRRELVISLIPSPERHTLGLPVETYAGDPLTFSNLEFDPGHKFVLPKRF